MSSAPAPVIDLTPYVAPVASYQLYNPADEEVARDFGAKTFRFPPSTEDRGFGPGVLNIADLPVRGLEDSKGVSRIDLVPAIKVVQYFCGEDGRSGKLSEIGIRPLPGRPDLDEAVKQEANSAYEEFKYQHCLTLKITHMQRVKKEQEAGLAITPPDHTIRAAMAYVAQVEQARGMSGAVVCGDCGWAVPTQADLVAHVAQIHPEKASQEQSFAPKPQPAAVIAQAAEQARVQAVVAARPRPQAQAQAQPVARPRG